MPVARRADLAPLAERAAWCRQRAAALTPPWGSTGLGEVEGCTLRALVAEAYLLAIRRGVGTVRARAEAEVVGAVWAVQRAREAASEEADCAAALHASA